MKRKMYTVELEVGDKYYHRTYSVVASNAVEAIRKGTKQARKDTNRMTGWRCIHLCEQKQDFVV